MIHSASNGVINSSSLCLVPGQLVRVVYLDAVCLNDSGNSFDAALLACMLALKNGTLFLVICTSVLCLLLAKLFVPELDNKLVWFISTTRILVNLLRSNASLCRFIMAYSTDRKCDFSIDALLIS